MSLRISLLFVLCLCIVSCSHNKAIVKTISIDVPLNEKCYFFIDANLDTLNFERTIKITKNTITDTIVFGQGVLRPNFKGDIKYTKLKNRNDISLDLDYKNPSVDRICIKSYKGKKGVGFLELELKPTNQ